MAEGQRRRGRVASVFQGGEASAAELGGAVGVLRRRPSAIHRGQVALGLDLAPIWPGGPLPWPCDLVLGLCLSRALHGQEALVAALDLDRNGWRKLGRRYLLLSATFSAAAAVPNLGFFDSTRSAGTLVTGLVVVACSFIEVGRSV
jgi:hypothetical protein